MAPRSSHASHSSSRRRTAGSDRRAGDHDPEEHEAAAHARDARFRQAVQQADDPYEVARIIVLNRLNAAPRTRAELEQTLLRRGIPQPVADQVLARMEEVDLINDGAYANAWVTSRHAGRGLARRALKVELHRKGIDPETAAIALSQVDDEDEAAAAAELVRRRLRTVAGLPRQKQVNRLVGMLARKGYGAGVAYSVVNAALDGQASQE